jgi:hypothetical protein
MKRFPTPGLCVSQLTIKVIVKLGGYAFMKKQLVSQHPLKKNKKTLILDFNLKVGKKYIFKSTKQTELHTKIEMILSLE